MFFILSNVYAILANQRIKMISYYNYFKFLKLR